METAVAFRQFLAALEDSLPDENAVEAGLGRLVILLQAHQENFTKVASALGCQRVTMFLTELEEGSASYHQLVCCLPHLGLDCMKLLEGAVAMNEHFKNAPYEENVVLQYVAVNHLLATHRISQFVS